MDKQLEFLPASKLLTKQEHEVYLDTDDHTARVFIAAFDDAGVALRFAEGLVKLFAAEAKTEATVEVESKFNFGAQD